MFDTLNNLEASISAIRAYNYLVTAAVQQGDDFSSISGGMHLLLEAQVDALQASHDALRRETSALKKERDEFSAKLAPINSRNEINANELGVKVGTQLAVPGADYYLQNQTTIARLQAEGRTLDEIVMLTGLARDRVRVFVETMPDDVREAAAKPRTREIRNAFIAERMRDGCNPSEIAQALNLKRSTVEKVIGRLLGTNIGETGEGDERKAINE